MGVCLLDLAHATFPYFGGYEPLTDVTAHSKIDLDLSNIMDNLGGTCGSSCTLKDCDPPTSVAAEGTGCNYDGVTVEFPSGDTCQWGNDKALDSGEMIRHLTVVHAVLMLTLMISGLTGVIQKKILPCGRFPLLPLGLQQKAPLPVFRIRITSTLQS